MAYQRKIYLPVEDGALLAECVMTAFRASGPGGQHVNTTDSAVRLEHLPSGITVTDQSSRSQHRNRANCVRKLREEVARRNYRPPVRKPSKPSRSSMRRVQEAKKRHADKKANRRYRPED